MSLWDYVPQDTAPAADEREVKGSLLPYATTPQPELDEVEKIPTTVRLQPETIEDAERVEATIDALMDPVETDELEPDPDVESDEPEVVPGQANLFGDNDQFTVAGQEWQGMPEYVSGNLTPWKSMLVHFEKLEDLQAFAELVQQPITTRTKSIWYPASDVFHFIDKRYATEEAS